MNESLLQELLALQQRDIETRAHLLQEGRLYGTYSEEMRRIHRDNAERLNELVERNGWPGIASVGLEGSRAAWLVAQHAICTPSLQRKFHHLMAQAAEKGDVPKRQVAVLEDRILFNEGKPQIYGSVLDWNERGELSCPISEPASVDARRTEVGLPPFEEDLQKQREAARAEGAVPPSDYAAYRQRAEEWARSIGWRYA